jgi:hypothetical protein
MTASSKTADVLPRRGLALTVAAMTIAACSSGETGEDSSGQPATSTARPESPAGTSSVTAGENTAQGEENAVDIQITIDGQRFEATLTDSAATDDLVAQLPTTIDMSDHGGVEKTGRLPGSLSLDGQPEGADPDVGDVGYYAPGNDLVLYYGDQSYFPGIVVLGRLRGDAAARIAELDGSVTAVIESAIN